MRPYPSAPQQNDAPPSSGERIGNLVYLGALALITCLVAWLEVRGNKGDSVAYYDLSNAVQQGNWRACFNASWSPLYPALLAAGRALFHFDLRYAAAAGRLVSIAVGLALFAAAHFLALSIRSYVVRHSSTSRFFLSRSSLLVWTTSFTFFFWANDMNGQKPDTLLAVLLLLATALLIRGLASSTWLPFVLAGIAAGGAYWAKSFAFPCVGLLLLFLMISQWKSPRALLQIAATGMVFLAVALPYIAHISADKHRFTIGDAGRLNSAWYVNGADRQNPVADRQMDNFGKAEGTYKHPAELLATSPEIAWFAPGKVFGAMPAWADFSYWSDGLSSRFVPGQYLRNVIGNSRALLLILPFRIQALALVFALWIFGLKWRPRQTASPALIAVVAAAAMSIVLYLLVHFEGRYIVFAAVICGMVFAASASSSSPPERARLHQVLLIAGCLLLVAEAQFSLRLSRNAAPGDRPLAARFDVSEYNVGQDLVRQFGPHPQVACLGWDACYNDALWAWYGEATVPAAIAVPHLQESGSAAEACQELNSNAAALEAMRRRGLRAVVGYFAPGTACAPQWQTVADAPGYYLLPL